MNLVREPRKSENARETDGPGLFIMPVWKITGDALCGQSSVAKMEGEHHGHAIQSQNLSEVHGGVVGDHRLTGIWRGNAGNHVGANTGQEETRHGARGLFLSPGAGGA